MYEKIDRSSRHVTDSGIISHDPHVLWGKNNDKRLSLTLNMLPMIAEKQKTFGGLSAFDYNSVKFGRTTTDCQEMCYAGHVTPLWPLMARPGAEAS